MNGSFIQIRTETIFDGCHFVLSLTLRVIFNKKRNWVLKNPIKGWNLLRIRLSRFRGSSSTNDTDFICLSMLLFLFYLIFLTHIRIISFLLHILIICGLTNSWFLLMFLRHINAVNAAAEASLHDCFYDCMGDQLSLCSAMGWVLM